MAQYCSSYPYSHNGFIFEIDVLGTIESTKNNRKPQKKQQITKIGKPYFRVFPISKVWLFLCLKEVKKRKIYK